MRTDLDQAFVLHRRAYRETSLHIELFSRSHGRVALLAKGANRPRSNLRGVLQAFTPLLAAWVSRSDLGVLTSAELSGVVPVLDGRRLLSAFYLNELIMRMVHRFDPHPHLFDAYAQTLDALNGNEVEESILRRFEVLLLKEVGYGLVLDRDVSGAEIAPQRQYSYQHDRGPVLSSADATDDVLVHGETLIALAKGRFESPAILREAKALMRRVLRAHLGPKPLVSRRLFNDPKRTEQ